MSTLHHLHRLVARVLPLLALCVVPLVAVTSATAGTPSSTTQPRPDTVIRVTGDAQNGFSIVHLDGSSEHPPTTSEALAECGEYDTRVDRARCRVGVRTWYRDLAVLRRAINYQRSLR